jgi:hypothetical protein
MRHDVYHTVAVELFRGIHELVGKRATVVGDYDQWVTKDGEHVSDKCIESLFCRRGLHGDIEGELGQCTYHHEYVFIAVASREFSFVVEVYDLERT